MRRRRKLAGAALIAFAASLGGCTADTFAGADAGGDAGGSDAADGGGGCTCTAPDLCCVYSSSQGTTYTCAASCTPSTSGQDLSALACTSTADCGGASAVCCIWRSNNVNQSACLPQCDSTLNQVQLCDPSSGSAGCPATEPCSTNNIADWRLPQSFGTCGGVGVP
ncbi:MAG TPA: hypothetical protein VLM85_33845 [Polyangiaceae bacterium]|nr:hypothetical protein [Polyangiaceae bacterium]